MAARIDIIFYMMADKLTITAVSQVALKHARVPVKSAEKSIRNYFAEKGETLVDGRYRLTARIAPKLEIQHTTKDLE